VTNPEFQAKDFYIPGRTLLYSEELNATHDRAGEMLARLTLGETMDLPDGVLYLLRDHTRAINTSSVGALRIRLFDTLYGRSAFDEQDATAVADQLEHLMKRSNEAATNIELNDIMIAAQFRRIGGLEDDQNIA